MEFPDVDFLAGKTGSAGSMREVILGGIVFWFPFDDFLGHEVAKSAKLHEEIIVGLIF